MAFLRSQMLYPYKWTAKDDSDNPYYRGGSDRAQLNREEGYEVLYFINHLGKKHWTNEPSLGTYQKVEQMIKTSVPSDIRKRELIANWIIENWKKVDY